MVKTLEPLTKDTPILDLSDNGQFSKRETVIESDGCDECYSGPECFSCFSPGCYSCVSCYSSD